MHKYTVLKKVLVGFWIVIGILLVFSFVLHSFSWLREEKDLNIRIGFCVVAFFGSLFGAGASFNGWEKGTVSEPDDDNNFD
jgi:hypothetical protein